MPEQYIRVKELAGKWGVSPRRINQLCTQDYFPGAYKQGKFWMIPSDARRPSVLREKKGTADYIAKAREKAVYILTRRALKDYSKKRREEVKKFKEEIRPSVEAEFNYVDFEKDIFSKYKEKRAFLFKKAIK